MNMHARIALLLASLLLWIASAFLIDDFRTLLGVLVAVWANNIQLKAA